MDSAFEKIKKGLEDSILHEQGKIRLDSKEVKLPDKPKPMSANKIANIRKNRLKVSQRAFAKIINAAPQTVTAWEHGRSKPSGCALRFLELLDKKPELIAELVESNK